MDTNFIETVECLCLPPCERIDKYVILNRREAPVKMMGLEKDIVKDEYYHSPEDYIERIHQLYDENEVTEICDGKVMNFYSIPIGFYTDYDGGYAFKSGKCNYVVFKETVIPNEKKKTINIISAAEAGVKFIKTFNVESLGNITNIPNVTSSNKDLKWLTSRFFAMVFKVGFSTYEGYQNYKYHNISEDVHSYIRVSYLGVNENERDN